VKRPLISRIASVQKRLLNPFRAVDSRSDTRSGRYLPFQFLSRIMDEQLWDTMPWSAKDGTEPFRGRIVDGQTVLWSGPWPASKPSSRNHAIMEQTSGGHPPAWPAGTRIQIGTIQATTPQIGDEVSRSLIETLVGLEFCVLARPDIRHILNDELQLHLANRVSDRAFDSCGRMAHC
jgi:hypothetical protein